MFEYDDYKAYLTAFLGSLARKGRGGKPELARLAGCQVAYLSRIFHSKADLSLEQALAICPRLGLTKPERDFFLLLVQRNRAGTPQLRSYCDEQIRQLRRIQTDLESRFAVKPVLGKAAQQKYYSSWRYLAIHIAISVPALQTEEALAKYFGIAKKDVREALEFLTSVDLARLASDGRRFTIGMSRLHLGRNSEFIQKHHLHWRLQASLAVEKNREEDLHYSAMVSLSEVDAVKLREALGPHLGHLQPRGSN